MLGWVLWGIGSDPTLGKTWAFKGGTCLKKCYFETFRFSEDLDFTVLPGGPISREDVLPLLEAILRRVHEESGLDFTRRRPRVKPRDDGGAAEGRIYYIGPRGAPDVASVVLDLSGSEIVARPTVLRPIGHGYPDALPSPASVRCYAFEEVFAEKLRAMGERGRPRDLYDIVHLFRRRDLAQGSEIVRKVLTEKCRSKGVAVPSTASIRGASTEAELRSEWESMLGHQLPELPPFELFWEEVSSLFSWLNGERVFEEMPAIPLGEEENAGWSPPPLVTTWQAEIPLETVRFAGANHLCLELGYEGTRFLIEPYSLRMTREGHLLLHAIRVESGEHRVYRVDRIESVHISKQTFRPRHRIELTPAGPMSG